MKSPIRRLGPVLLLGFATPMFLTACPDGDLESAGEEVDDAIDDAGDAADDAVDEVEDEIDRDN